jgi:bifunctional ADP-heptose synthase (sugar kinase/adenylyltransferase)
MFDEISALDIIKDIRPHIWVKGGDLSLETIPQDQRQALEEMGTEIRFVPVLEGYSTTALVQKAREQ